MVLFRFSFFHRLAAPTTYSLLLVLLFVLCTRLTVFRLGNVYLFDRIREGGVYLFDRGKPHRITQVFGNRLFKSSDDSGVRGDASTQPEAGSPLTGD